MSANKYIPVGVLVNSCLIGANAYRVTSDEAEFSESPLEEITDVIRQRPGHHYMRVCTALDKTELWMVPFGSTPERLLTLQDAMELVQGKYLGTPGFHFPFDLVEEETDDLSVPSYVDPEAEEQVIANNATHDYAISTAYVLKPFDRAATKPLRDYLPNAAAPRWEIAKNLFARVMQLHKMGLSSNGISREQVRVNPQTWEVELWLNHTLRTLSAQGPDMYHQGFGTIPVKTARMCKGLKHPINCVQRDIFSCAVLAFYLLHYTHPFVGSKFAPLSRDDYLSLFSYAPAYIMDPEGDNHLGNQQFDREVEHQWEKTVPELKELFNGLFMAVSHPDTKWRAQAPWWNIQKWLDALEADAKQNDNETSRSTYKFSNYLYRLA